MVIVINFTTQRITLGLLVMVVIIIVQESVVLKHGKDRETPEKLLLNVRVIKNPKFGRIGEGEQNHFDFIILLIL